MRLGRAGGIGVLVYAASPTFYTFASWDYGPLRWPLRLRRFTSCCRRSTSGRVSTSTINTAQKVQPVELSGRFFTPGETLAGHRQPGRAGGDASPDRVANGRPARGLGGGPADRGRREQARLVGVAAVINVVLVGGWSAFVGSHLVSYLSPLLRAATTGSLRNGAAPGSRKLFQTSSSQGGSAHWEIVVMVAAVVCFCLMLVPSVLAVIRRRTVEGGTLRYLPVMVAAGYPVRHAGQPLVGELQVGERTTTFIFFGMAIVIGGWLATRISIKRGLLGTVGTVVIATVCLLGGMIFGSGPDVTYVPGPYLVGANQRSVSAPSLAMAQWASTNLPAGSNVAADRQNGALLADIGHINMVTGISGLVDASPLFFSGQFDSSELSLIRKDHIRYIVMDRRLASSLPLFGSYLSQGEAKPGTKLTIAELGKFDAVPGVSLVYDNGSIEIFDLSTLLGPVITASTRPSTMAARRRTRTGRSSRRCSGPERSSILVRFRRRRRTVRVTEGGDGEPSWWRPCSGSCSPRCSSPSARVPDRARPEQPGPRRGSGVGARRQAAVGPRRCIGSS